MVDKEKESGPLFAIQKPQPLELSMVDPSALAVAEAAKARIQAMHIMALKRPRSVETARDSILRACKRTGFAERVEFAKPVGGRTIKGPSVRFAELAIKEWGNVDTDSTVIYDDSSVRKVKVYCVDLETNVNYSRELVINKTVERKKVTEDREIVGERTNVKGEKVYIVRATDDELQNKESAMISKAFRNEGLRLIPTDIVDEAIEMARQTLKARDEQDPNAAKKQVLDSFSDIGVRPKDVEAFLGHTLDQLVPAELQTLRGMYRAIKDGEATWREYTEKEGKEEEVEVDPALVAKFDQDSTERKVDQQMLQVFLSEIATSMNMTVDQIKVEALKETTKFWNQYDLWAKSPKRTKKGVA